VFSQQTIPKFGYLFHHRYHHDSTNIEEVNSRTIKRIKSIPEGHREVEGGGEKDNSTAQARSILLLSA
jgi:hypothetical protein